MSRRLKMIVAYDGESFSGWQSQANRNAIQDHLERALKEITGEDLRVHGAGRTDAGVHALAQCAHVDATKQLTAARWLGALNAILPVQIRVLRCGFVSQKFHSRFSAKGKIYRYRIWSDKVLLPLERGRVWHLIAPLDFAAMKSAAAKFSGRHDFAGFAANLGDKADTIRTIRSIKIRRTGPLITIECDGDGFLYKMVRLMVGTIVEVGSGKVSIQQVSDRLRGHGNPRSRLVAPAGGLFLVRVRY